MPLSEESVIKAMTDPDTSELVANMTSALLEISGLLVLVVDGYRYLKKSFENGEFQDTESALMFLDVPFSIAELLADELLSREEATGIDLIRQQVNVYKAAMREAIEEVAP